MPTIATLSEMTAPIPMTTSQIAPVFKRLVVAYDFSSYADTAFDYAMDIATKHNSEIILVHMQKPCDDSTAGSDGAAARMVTSDLGKCLEQKVDCARRLGIETRWLLQTGMPVDVLAQVVTDLKPDILFLGAYENDRLDRKALGSTVDYLLRTLSCPVVTIGPNAVKQKVDPGQAERVICPFNFPEGVDHRLKTVARLTKTLGAYVELVHAVEVGPENPRALSAAITLFEFSLLVGRLLKEGVPAQSALLFGAPERVIAEHAREVNAHFIMFGLHHETRLLRGSRTNLVAKVIRSAPCAVFTSGTRLAWLVSHSP